MLAIILWRMGHSSEKAANSLEAWYDTKWNPNFCIIPGHDDRCFTYTYDLPTQKEHDTQFWAMVDFVNEQAWIKKSEGQET